MCTDLYFFVSLSFFLSFFHQRITLGLEAQRKGTSERVGSHQASCRHCSPAGQEQGRTDLPPGTPKFTLFPFFLLFFSFFFSPFKGWELEFSKKMVLFIILRLTIKTSTHHAEKCARNISRLKNIEFPLAKIIKAHQWNTYCPRKLSSMVLLYWLLLATDNFFNNTHAKTNKQTACSHFSRFYVFPLNSAFHSFGVPQGELKQLLNLN